jgi:anti-sigma factor RsiW
MMTCPSRRTDNTLLLDYASGRLPGAQAADVARHANECDECAAALLEYSSVSEALDLWEAPPVSAHFNRRLWDRIESAASAPLYVRVADWLRFHSLKPAIPVAAAALAIAAGFLLDHTSTANKPPATNRVSATEADQAERTLDDLQLLRQFDAAVAAPRPARPM